MKKYSKLIAVICAVFMCLSVCMFSVYADNESGAQPADPGGQGSESQSSQSGGEQSDVPYIPDQDSGQSSESQSSDVPYIPDQDSGSSYVDGGGNEGGGYDSQTSYESSYDGGGSSSNVYYDSDGNSYSNQSDVYVGGGQSYQPPVSTAPPAALYDTDKKIDVKELSKNDWGDIAKQLKNSGQTDSSGVDDFAFIQKNTSKTDNGHWIMIAGITCIALSVAGFIYLIVSNINKRRKIKAGNISRSTPGKSANQYRSNDDYNDGYGSNGSGYKKSAPKQPEKKSSSSRHSGGRRYR